MSKKKPPSSNNLVPIITTIIGVVGTIVVAYFASVVPIEREISATQKAEFFRATQTAEANRIFLLTVGSTNTAESVPIILTLFPTPTSWPLGTKTYRDEQNLCQITVNDFQDANRENAIRVQFNSSGQTGFCSWIVPLNGYDATSKKQVVFWIKGEKGEEEYKVGIKDTKTMSGREPKVSETASASWTQVSIPLKMFKGQDLSSLENFSLNFNVGSGIVYVDQLNFTP
jgi:hypothetical protein